MGPRFLGPNWAWTNLYEPLIWRAAGLGRAPSMPDSDRYANIFAHCDVLIAGGGPAGLAAALAASDSGARVIIADEQSEFGGALLGDPTSRIEGIGAADWLSQTVARLRQMPNVRLLPRTQVFGYFAQNFLGLVERCTDHLAKADVGGPRERLWQVRAKEVVLATGAIERPLVFPGNDRPGIMLADAARTYITRYGAIPGRRALVLTATDTAYDAAIALAQTGVDVAAIADLREAPAGPASEMARRAGVPILPATTILATSGRLRVTHVTLGNLRGEGVERSEKITCDLVLVSGGWTPSVHLYSQSRGKVVWNEAANAFLPGAPVQRERSAGACRGAFGLTQALNDGFAAGADAAGAAMGKRVMALVVSTTEAQRSYCGLSGACPLPARSQPAFVDFQNDVTASDLRLATQEGFRSIEHVKRYTTTGMATDQGKTSNLNAAAIVAGHVGKSVAKVALPTFRQPYTPVTFGALAGFSRGELFDPVRRSPIDNWAEENGAVFEDVGLWRRARYFPRRDEDMHAAVARECRTVRTDAGLFDASTLGKIEVVGPDAAEFLERMYVNSWKKLDVGRCRYGILLSEAGFILDDGVVGRLAATIFHVTTTTGGAASVLHVMEDYLQTEFPDLKVWLTSTTEQWAVIAVQGPKARDVLRPLVVGTDLDNDGFPHMSVRECRICGVAARLFRVSFTGELGFEVNVPADYGRGVWEAIWQRATAYDACAYGTETMHILRAEKGFIVVGQETDGTVTPDDVGLGRAIGKQKRDFVGKRSLARPDMVKPGRKQLVGLRTLDPNVLLEEGAQVTAAAAPTAGTPALGHVTSAYRSEALGSSIALAMIADGRTRMGETLHVPMPTGAVPVVVVAPVFLDPNGERVNG
jgi:sarcosine oxidase subunit alpha